jgi:sporulation protein YlmC with PRC-barrel domain
MRGSDLQGKTVTDRDGRRLGRLHELHLRDGVVVSFVCGPAGLLQRLGASRRGRRIPWSAVEEVTDKAIVVRET